MHGTHEMHGSHLLKLARTSMTCNKPERNTLVLLTRQQRVWQNAHIRSSMILLLFLGPPASVHDPAKYSVVSNVLWETPEWGCTPCATGASANPAPFPP